MNYKQSFSLCLSQLTSFMQLNFFKKPLGFVLFLTICSQIFNIITMPIIFPNRILKMLLVIISIYIYSHFYKFKFSTKFIFKSFLWHFIPSAAIPLIILSDTKSVQEVYGLLINGHAMTLISSAIAILAVYSLLFFFCCWLGNLLAISDRKLFPVLSRPLLFASTLVFLFLSINSTLFISTINADHFGNTIPLAPHAIARLFFVVVFVLIFSFLYTFIYQERMTRKFKVFAIIEIVILFSLLLLGRILLNPMMRTLFLEYIHNLTGLQVIRLISDNLITFTNFILFAIFYLLITLGNRIAFRNLSTKVKTHEL